MKSAKQGVIAIVALAVLAVPLLPSAWANAAAAPSFASDEPSLYRGTSARLFGTGFETGQSYTITANYGEFASTGGRTANVTVGSEPDNVGDFDVLYSLTADTPAAVTAVDFAITDASDAVVATAAVNVAAPRLDASACPARTINEEGYGFPAGTYTLASPEIAFDAGPFTVTDDGRLEVTGGTAKALPPSFQVSATLNDASHTSYSFVWSLAAPNVSVDRGVISSERVESFTCFAPGEAVTIHRNDARSTASPVRADSNGVVTIDEVLLPSANPTRTAGVTVRGTVSAQSADAGPAPIAGTTLTVHHALSQSYDPQWHLFSRNTRYSFGENACRAYVEYESPHNGGRSVQWITPGRPRSYDCRLVMQTNGDLRLVTRGGTTVWHSNTKGSHYRLLMQDDGDAVVYNSAGHSVWTSRYGKRKA